jgi:hypothetical protein
LTSPSKTISFFYFPIFLPRFPFILILVSSMHVRRCDEL